MDQSAIHRYFTRRNNAENIYVHATDEGVVLATDRIVFVDVTAVASRFSWCRQALETPGKSLIVPKHHMKEGATANWWARMEEHWKTWSVAPPQSSLFPTAVVAEADNGERYRIFTDGSDKPTFLNDRVLAMLGPTRGHLRKCSYALLERGMVRVRDENGKVVMLTMGLTGMVGIIKLNGGHVEVPFTGLGEVLHS